MKLPSDFFYLPSAVYERRTRERAESLMRRHPRHSPSPPDRPPLPLHRRPELRSQNRADAGEINTMIAHAGLPYDAIDLRTRKAELFAIMP